MRWMNLAPIIQSEVSQKEKNRNRYINIYIYRESRKMVLMNLVVGQQWDIDIEDGLMDKGRGEEGEGEMNGEGSTEAYALPYVK